MAKPEWGVKRTCQSCGTRFYDMQRSPIVCPKCQSVVEPEVTFKSRRSSAAPAAEPKVVAPVAEEVLDADLDAVELETPEEEEEEEAEAEGETEAGSEDGDEDQSGLIEDASDLGEDDDDMAEVMEHLDENIEDEV